MVYAITYDLNKSGQDYSSLFAKIRSMGDSLKPLQNLWLLSSSYSVETVRDELHSTMDNNDSLFVARLSSGSYGACMAPEAHDWIEARL